ncbi:DinB family protein [Polaribacter aquimarinus]|uniref:DinB family protein n=1 Tax=Polaribacter aquimarinus TaxID=2100726 RepID=A0A2U2JA30_9FLAO|nr:DinB family protein [Polaribacter aquimarinus]PWG05200.1 DinB family protein [Polaribacter aquimarinus]
MKKQVLNANEFDSYYQRYIDKLHDKTELIQGFIDGKTQMISFLKSIPEIKLNFSYQPEKWSIKEILQHLIDTERIFIYRCFRIARKDTTALAGYDQDVYIKPSNADKKSLDDLLNEFIINRNNSIALLQSLTTDDLCFIGNANDGKMSARAAAFIIIGHDIWHIEVIKEKYL